MIGAVRTTNRAVSLISTAEAVVMTTAPPDVRITTAVQPPRIVHAGLRVTF